MYCKFSLWFTYKHIRTIEISGCIEQNCHGCWRTFCKTGVTLAFPFQFQYHLKIQFELYTIAILPLTHRQWKECVLCVVCYMCYPNGLVACDKPDQWNYVTVRAGGQASWSTHTIHSTLWFLLYMVNTTQNKQATATGKNIKLKKKQQSNNNTTTIHTVNNWVYLFDVERTDCVRFGVWAG